jgi:hypothetical protein|nr:MAG TPA: hypothetical protein [Caudoviricetes sp.]
MRQFEETGIANEITKVLTEKYNFLWDSAFSLDAIKTMFSGMAQYLGQVKSKKVVKACRFDTGTFHIGAYVSFMPSDEDENRGSYNLSFTFDPKDIPEGAEIVDFSDPVFRHIVSDEGYNRYRILFTTYDGQDYMTPAFAVAADCIKEYLRANVDVDPELELKDFFIATVQADGKENYYAITPSATLKQYVKDDAALEEEVAA